MQYNSTTQNVAPRWMKLTLRIAGIYNVLWGGLAICLPVTFFRWAGFEPLPAYPQFWQCIGMIVGVYGIGYWLAADDPYRHWPIVLVGLLGKILGPIGFLNEMIMGSLPLKLGWTILTNDLIWWLPFALILRQARLHHKLASRYVFDNQTHPGGHI